MTMIQCAHCQTQMHPTANACPSCGAPSARTQDNTSNNPFHWYAAAFAKYATFSGRARRKEYWMFVLANIILTVGVSVIDGLLHAATVISTLYSLATLLPALAAGVRRLHDGDRSGWWIIVPIVNLVFLIPEGTRGENRFGKDPKQPH